MEGAPYKSTKGDGHHHVSGKEYEKMEANMKGGTTFQFVYSQEVDVALKELQGTQAGQEVDAAIKRVEDALQAAKEDQHKKEEKVFGGVSRKRLKNAGPSEVELALHQLESVVNEKYTKRPPPTSTGHTHSTDGKEKSDRHDKHHQAAAQPALPVHISNLVSMYRGMVEMALSLEKSERDRVSTPDRDPDKEKANRSKNKSARQKRVKSVMK